MLGFLLDYYSKDVKLKQWHLENEKKKYNKRKPTEIKSASHLVQNSAREWRFQYTQERDQDVALW